MPISRLITFETLAQAGEVTTGENDITLQEFWKKYSIKHAIANIHDAWEEVTASSMRAVWQKIVLKCANDFTGFDTPLIDVIDDIAAIGRNLGFEEVDGGNVREFLEAHGKEMTNEDLMEIDEQPNDEIDIEKENASKEITIHELQKNFKMLLNVQNMSSKWTPTSRGACSSAAIRINNLSATTRC